MAKEIRMKIHWHQLKRIEAAKLKKKSCSRGLKLTAGGQDTILRFLRLLCVKQFYAINPH
jgi:hypothetical protein